MEGITSVLPNGHSAVWARLNLRSVPVWGMLGVGKAVTSSDIFSLHRSGSCWPFTSLMTFKRSVTLFYKTPKFQTLNKSWYKAFSFKDTLNTAGEDYSFWQNTVRRGKTNSKQKTLLKHAENNIISESLYGYLMTKTLNQQIYKKLFVKCLKKRKQLKVLSSATVVYCTNCKSLCIHLTLLI